MKPDDILYSRDHQWVAHDGRYAVVGITDYAQRTLGEMSYVDLPRLGKRVRAGESLAVLESVKAASDLPAPVAGVVKEVNTALKDKPEWINQDPCGKGWICRLESVEFPVSGLMTAQQYGEFCKMSS